MNYEQHRQFTTEQSWRRNGPYKEYLPGDRVDFTVRTLHSDGSLTTEDKWLIIEGIRGGGFFGQVLIPQDQNFVIKTSLPDPLHHLWRTIRWELKPFPAQNIEVAAQLEHLSTRLINKVVPILTNGKFQSPDSLGYTQLPTGYAQVLEKMYGRGPRDKNEALKFRQAQKEIIQLALNLGLEQAGQVNPNNPFSLANLWWNDEKGVWIWLDTIPAIPHKAWEEKLLSLDFNKVVRDWFYQKVVTFGRVHTAYFLNEINQHRHSFSDQDFEEIKANLYLYEKLWEDKEETVKNDKHDLRLAIKPLTGLIKQLTNHSI
ncbi:MAG: hypothetical protein Q8P89_00305 [bacterium]|nr:hypothetical protein [bacterium]